MMRAYFASPSISVLADYPCYHWVLRDRDQNASWGRLDPESYFENMGEVLDIVDEHTEPGEFRDRLYARWYRGKMLNRVEKVLSNPDAEHRMALYRAMHELAVARFPESVDARLPFNLRERSRLLRAGRLDELAELATFERKLRARRARDVGPLRTATRSSCASRVSWTGLRFERERRTRRLGPGALRRDRRAGRLEHDPAAAQAALDAGGVPRAGRDGGAARRRPRRRRARGDRAVGARRPGDGRRRRRGCRAAPGRSTRSRSSPGSARSGACAGRAAPST